MMTLDISAPIHATCVAITGRGVLLVGPSGAGKSDLALRLIDRGGVLVGDDRVMVRLSDEKIWAEPGPHLQGLLEVRGLGIVKQPFLARCPVDLAVILTGRDEVPRLPERQAIRLGDASLCALWLHAFDISTPIKIEFALGHAPIDR